MYLYKISIVIPFFNVERYLVQCLDSVFDQDLSESEYEVICVNDGSTDGSREIVESYLPNHHNLRLIDHPCNMKLGAARNTGRMAARGKYIWNVDSDDYIQSNCLKSLVCECEQDNLDILIFDFYHVDINGEAKRNNDRCIVHTKCTSGKDFILTNASLIGEFSPVWTQIYRKSFLDEYKILSPPINAGEDVPFSYGTLYLAKKIRFINKHYYYYRNNPSSIGGKIESCVIAGQLYEKCFVCSRYLSQIISKDVKEKNIKQIYSSIIKYILNWLVEYYPRLGVGETDNFKTMCRKNIKLDKCLLPYMNKKLIKTYLFEFICP